MIMNILYTSCSVRRWRPPPPRHAASRHVNRHYGQKHEIFCGMSVIRLKEYIIIIIIIIQSSVTLEIRVEVTIPTLRNSSIHSSDNVTRLGTFKFRGETLHACAIVLDWSWSPIHKLTGLDVGETRWDNATWCNTTPHSYTDGQRRTN